MNNVSSLGCFGEGAAVVLSCLWSADVVSLPAACFDGGVAVVTLCSRCCFDGVLVFLNSRSADVVSFVRLVFVSSSRQFNVDLVSKNIKYNCLFHLTNFQYIKLAQISLVAKKICPIYFINDLI